MGSGGGGGGGGSSVPPFEFERAKEIVDEAYKQQQKAREQLEQRAVPYEGKREFSQEELGKLLTGRTGPEAVSSYEQRFAEGMPAITREFETKQKTFQPGLLDTSRPDSSFNLLTNVLRGSAQEYGTAMNQASGRASSRLYEALATPIAGFELAAQSPAFSALRNPAFMEYAKRPPTVSTDVDSYRQFMTYNV